MCISVLARGAYLATKDTCACHGTARLTRSPFDHRLLWNRADPMPSSSGAKQPLVGSTLCQWKPLIRWSAADKTKISMIYTAW